MMFHTVSTPSSTFIVAADDVKLAEQKAAECPFIAAPSSPYTIEIDSQRRLFDFYSKKKTINKNFERVVSIKSHDNKRFHIERVMIDGRDVCESWLCSIIDATVSASKEILDPIQDAPSEETSMSVVTPTESSSKKKKPVDTTTGNDTSVLRGLSVSMMQSFIDFYFTCPLASIGEEDDMARKDSVIIPLLISIEGNIGAGKSYLLGNLRKAHPEWCFIDEPVAFWESLRNDGNESLLEVFYKDQRRWSYTFQNCALLSRFHNIESAITKVNAQELEARAGIKRPAMCKVFITERCLDTDHEVFAKMLHSDGQLDALEIDLYQRWFRMLQKTATPLSAIVYVDTMPGTCSERINIRARDGEGGIPLSYLESLDKFQRRWIDTTSVPIMRTPSDYIHVVESFVAQLIENNTPSV
jgi:deoxyadenosine/deoxycytidine kinase